MDNTKDTVVHSLMERKVGKACPMCSEFHPAATACNRSALLSKITKLMEVNQGIPAILHSLKEATTLAQNYQFLLKKADEAHIILMSILSTYGAIGEQIKQTYLKELDAWAGKEHTSQDTSEGEQLNLFDQSTSTVTEISDFTKQQSGSDSVSSSSNSIQSATAAEKNQKPLTT